MKKKATIGAVIVAIVTGLSGFAWLPDVAASVRDYVSIPLREEMREQYKVMASMKHYDIRTDELAETVDDMKALIKTAEKELLDATETGSDVIQQRIDTYKQIQQKNRRKLDKDRKSVV